MKAKQPPSTSHAPQTSWTQLRNSLHKAADSEKKAILQRFFKTGPGQYGEGDQFLGIVVPQIRALAKAHQDLSLSDLKNLICSPFHEERLAALLVLVLQAKKAQKQTPKTQVQSKSEAPSLEKIARFYLEHKQYVNNWDLVDLSAEHLLGPWIQETDLTLLEELASSPSVWDRRVAMLTTFHFIRKNSFQPALKIAKLLVHDEHDLIHKAVGWLLREIGKRDQATEEKFLKQYYKNMPRTMLRYAIERFPETLRQKYLAGKV